MVTCRLCRLCRRNAGRLNFQAWLAPCEGKAVQSTAVNAGFPSEALGGGRRARTEYFDIGSSGDDRADRRRKWQRVADAKARGKIEERFLGTSAAEGFADSELCGADAGERPEGAQGTKRKSETGTNLFERRRRKRQRRQRLRKGASGPGGAHGANSAGAERSELALDHSTRQRANRRGSGKTSSRRRRLGPNQRKQT